MTSILFIYGVFFGVQFLSSSCEGKIISPPEGKIFTFLPGSTEKITWTFDDNEDDLVSRSWTFARSDGSKPEILAFIIDKREPKTKNSSLRGIAIEAPATLILKDIDLTYNGTYVFRVQALDLYTREVTVYIAVKPTVTINCSSPTIVNEGDGVRCLCNGEGGNPPANVTWYKDGVQFGDAGDEEKILTLRNIDKKDGGTFKCVAQSYTLKDEKSIGIFVYYTIPPTVVSFTSTPAKAMIGKAVVITCEAIAVPVPSYTLIHNNTEVVSTEKTHIINVVKYNHVGSYECKAKNKLGNSSKNYYLSVVATRTTHAPNTTIHATEKAACSSSKGGTEWYIIVVTLPLSGIIVGILISCIFLRSCRWFRNRKPQSKPVPESSKTTNSIYQDLDLTKIKSEDDYQSLRVDSGTNDADYKNQSDSTYTELNKVRDAETNYQSLT